MLLAAMLAMVLAVTIPAVANSQGGNQESVNVANAENNCTQNFEQNQVAYQNNDIYQEADQYALALQAVIAANVALDDLIADDGSLVLAAAQGNQYQTQVGNVAYLLAATLLGLTVAARRMGRMLSK